MDRCYNKNLSRNTISITSSGSVYALTEYNVYMQGTLDTGYYLDFTRNVEINNIQYPELFLGYFGFYRRTGGPTNRYIVDLGQRALRVRVINNGIVRVENIPYGVIRDLLEGQYIYALGLNSFAETYQLAKDADVFAEQ